jgi:two-component system response regulator GlrR
MRVLVVDDEPDFLATCVRLLSLKGHEALTATNALDAMSRIDLERPDLVITDLRLGGPDGQAVVQHARRARPPLPVIIVSGHPSPDVVGTASRAGAELLAKPISPIQLMAAIDRTRPRPAGESA